MNKILIEKLLNAKTDDEFQKILLSEKIDYFDNRDLWDEKVIKHALKLFDLTEEQFERSFYKFTPKDDFNEKEL